MKKKRTNDTRTTIEKSFDDLKKEIMKVDPVAFAKNYLTIDGRPLSLEPGSGWKFLADIYRYVATVSPTENGKPVVITKGRQVGATTMATALELFFCTNDIYGSSLDKPPIRLLHCFPSLTNVQKFSKDKLSAMMRTSVDKYILHHALSYNEETGGRRVDVPDDTLIEKQFKNENKLWVESNANNAQRLQGMSVDGIFYDEVQRMRADDIGNSQKTLTASRYGPRGRGIQMFFGTPLQRGSNFHKLWEASDKRFYHLGCADCKKHFRLYELGSDSWEEIWLYKDIVKCPYCGHEQNKIGAVDRGKWIASQPQKNGKETEYVGFHFNQLLIPYFYKETVLHEKPGIHPTNSERIWKNEILGEFYSGSDLPMSIEEIYQYCRDIERDLSFKSDRSEAHRVYFMGIDWGGKADIEGSTSGKSFSSVVIASADQTGTLRVENAFKLKSNDFSHKLEIVDEMFRRFGLKMAVADLGYGSDIVPEIQKGYGGRVIGCMSSGSLLNPVKFDPEELRIIVNPHHVLEQLFSNMRKGKVKFPWKSYEKIEWLIEHCCSMEKEIRTVQGRQINRYVKGSGPNDGLMSLMYAHLAHKFYLTQGFKIKDFRLGAKSAMKPILAYVPNMR